LLDQFIDYLENIKRYSEHTISGYQRDLLDFERFIIQESLAPSLMEVKRSRIIRHYISHMQSLDRSSKTISRRLSSLRMYYEYCVEQGHLEINLMHEIQAPKIEKRLPKRIHDDEITTLFRLMDKTKPLTFRNYMMLDILYSCGLRASELVSLKIKDVDISERTFKILGKGQKMRYVPFTNTIAENLSHYLTYERADVLIHTGQTPTPYVFLSRLGKKMTVRNLEKMVQNVIYQSGETYQLHPHMLRHAFASTLLSHGADLRSVQELLGHEQLTSTQIYTHLDNKNIQKMYQSAHPRMQEKIKESS
jgi:integrase/recombinase XerC